MKVSLEDFFFSKLSSTLLLFFSCRVASLGMGSFDVFSFWEGEHTQGRRRRGGGDEGWIDTKIWYNRKKKGVERIVEAPNQISCIILQSELGGSVLRSKKSSSSF